MGELAEASFEDCEVILGSPDVVFEEEEREGIEV